MKKSCEHGTSRAKRIYRIVITIAIYGAIAYAFLYAYFHQYPPSEPSSFDTENSDVQLTKQNPWRKGKITLLTEREYLPEVLKQIRQANRSIDVMMFVFNNKYHAEQSLLHALIKARRRGRKVRVLLEFDHKENDLNQQHETLVKFLRAQGIRAWLDDPLRHLHTKLVSIDGGKTVITGSHNWTTPALTSLHEASFLIQSDTPPAALLDFIEDRFKTAQNIEKILIKTRREIEKFKNK